MNESVVAVVFASLFDLLELFLRAKLGIELPDLPADVIVERSQPWIPSLGNLQLPHSRFSQNAIAFPKLGDLKSAKEKKTPPGFQSNSSGRICREETRI